MIILLYDRIDNEDFYRFEAKRFWDDPPRHHLQDRDRFVEWCIENGIRAAGGSMTIQGLLSPDEAIRLKADFPCEVDDDAPTVGSIIKCKAKPGPRLATSGAI